MSSNLKLRIIFGLLYAGFIVAMLFWGQLGADILLSLFGALMLWEFISISFSEKLINNVLMVAINIVILIAIYYFLELENILIVLISVSLIYCLINITTLMIKKSALVYQKPKLPHMFLYISLPILIGLMMNREVEGFNMHLLYLFIVVWLCDVGAYFIGKGFGKHKLYPSISPKKTWEGFFGGVGAGILTSIAIHKITGVYDIQTWIILGIIICVTSVFGDLIESSLKRHYGIKDSSNIIPGHGGFLDRLDSFIFALPFYSFFILIFAK